MKILHVNHVLDPVSGGGTAERTVQLARFLKQQGAETAILTLDIGETGPYEKQLAQIPIFKLPCINRRYYVHASWPRHIRKIVAQFDVIHLMGHWTLLNAIVAFTCVRLGKPYVVCPAGALKSYGRSPQLKTIYDFFVGQWIIRKAALHVAITQDEKQDFLQYGIPITSVEVIPNGIDPEQYQLAEPIATLPHGLQEKIGESPYVLFLGRLNSIKGPDLLLEGFINISSQFLNVHLVFAGPDDGMRNQLLKTVTLSHVTKRIHFLGYVGGKDKVNLLSRACCLAIPSRNEAMSVVVLEAGVCETPVLFTDKCGLGKLAKAGAGILVEAKKDAIQSGLTFILSNPDKAKTSAEMLKSIVLSNFHWATQAGHYYCHYQKLHLQ